MKGTCKSAYIVLIASLLVCETVVSTSRFTNVICKSFDKKFAIFTNCRLTVPKRGTIALSLYLKLLQTPISNVTINLSLFKKVNGYRPFLNNITVDFCGFMMRKKRVPLAKIYFDAFAKFSNFNHSCPYDHDIIIKNFVLRDDMFALLPVPAGEYMFKTVYAVYNEWKVEIQLHIYFENTKTNVGRIEKSVRFNYEGFLPSQLYTKIKRTLTTPITGSHLVLTYCESIKDSDLGRFYLPSEDSTPLLLIDHDIIVKNRVLRDEMFGRMPVPTGEYVFKLMVGAYNEWKADVKTYFSIIIFLNI